MNRLKHLPFSDLAYSLYFKESFEFLESLDFQKVSIVELVKLCNVVQYEKDLKSPLLTDAAKETISRNKERIIKSKKLINEHFSHVSDKTFLSDIEELKNTMGVLTHDYIDAIERFAVSFEILHSSIMYVLEKHIIPLYVFLHQKKMSKFFEECLKKYMISSNDSIELFVSAYDERKTKNSREYYIPKSFSDAEIDIIINNYLESKFANYNVLECLVYHKNSKDTYKISASTKAKIKKIFEEKKDLMMDTGFTYTRDYDIQINPNQLEAKKYCEDGNRTVISFGGKWIEGYLNDKPTLLNNLIYLLELVDGNFRFSILPSKGSHSTFSEAFESQNKDAYGNSTFFDLDSLWQVVFFAYYNFLLGREVNLECVYEWFSNEYIKNEFGLDGFNIFLPANSENIILKVKNLFSEIEKMLKCYMVYQKYGEIDSDIFEEETLCKIEQLKSLNGQKYIYANPNSDINYILNLLFSDQSSLNYIEKGVYEDCFVNLVKKHSPSYQDFAEYKRNSLDYLLEKKIVYKNIDGQITLGDAAFISLLKELFSKGFLDIRYFDERFKNAYKIVESYGWIATSDTLFSKQESDYLNYYLNNSAFTNALALRNKYEHPDKLKNNFDDVYKDYVAGLKILGLIIIKINEELCYKFPEDLKVE